MQHPNGWHRDTAARLVCERAGEDAAPLLRDLLRAATNDVGRIHALHTLRSLGALGVEDVQLAARNSNAAVRVHALRASVGLGTTLVPLLEPLAGDRDERVRFQLALVTSNSVKRDPADPAERGGILDALGGAGWSGTGAGEVLAALAGDGAFNARPGADEFMRESGAPRRGGLAVESRGAGPAGGCPLAARVGAGRRGGGWFGTAWHVAGRGGPEVLRSIQRTGAPGFARHHGRGC